VTAAFPALGFDPAPGDPGRGEDLARTLHHVTAALGEVHDVVSGTGSQRWEGRAADEFRHLMSKELRPRITTAYQSFAQASRGFERWLQELDGFQRRARALEQEAEQHRAGLEHASSALAGLGDRPTDTSAGAAYDDRKAAHEAAARRSEAALEDVRRRARALAGEATHSATVAADLLHVAMDAAPNEPGLWDRLTDAVSSVGDFLGDCLEYIKDNWWNLLHRLVSVTATVLAVASLFCPPLAPFALGFAVADVAMSGVDWARGVPGAKEAFLTGALGLAGGAAFGAIAKQFMQTAGPVLTQGPYQLVANGGAAGFAEPVAAVLSVNPGFRPALAGYVLIKGKDAKDAGDAVTSMLGGNAYYSGALAAGWRKARND
jgi:hypothetical protein